jgi:hypothetical protein
MHIYVPTISKNRLVHYALTIYVVIMFMENTFYEGDK